MALQMVESVLAAKLLHVTEVVLLQVPVARLVAGQKLDRAAIVTNRVQSQLITFFIFLELFMVLTIHEFSFFSVSSLCSCISFSYFSTYSCFWHFRSPIKSNLF